MKKGVYPVVRLGVVPQANAYLTLQGAHQSGFNAAHYQAIGPFNLTVSLRMVDGCIVELNAQVSTPVFHLISCKIGAIISYDAVRDAIMVYHAGYKVDHWPCFSRFYWFGLYPFSEFIYDHQ